MSASGSTWAHPFVVSSQPTSLKAHVELRNTGKRFDAVVALANINLTVKRGAIHALVGENGAGKSTLDKIISGVIRPDQGQVIVSERRLSLQSQRARPLPVVFHAPRLAD